MVDICSRCGHDENIHDGMGFCLVNTTGEFEDCNCINVDIASQTGKEFWKNYPILKSKITLELNR